MTILDNMEFSDDTKSRETAVSEITRLESLCFPADCWSESSVRASLSRPDVFYGFEYWENKAVGYFLAAAAYDEGELYRIAVLPQYRGQGKGSALMNMFISRCSREAERIFLEVRASNKAAIALYEKFGFIRIGTRKNYYGDDDGVIYQRVQK